MHACLPVLNAPMSAPMPPKHENKETINIEFNTMLKRTKTLLLWFLHAFMSVHMPPKQENTSHRNMKTSTHKHRVQHNFEVDKNTTLLLWSSLSLPSIPWTSGGVWSYHRVTAASGHLSHWLVLCWTITTPSPHDVLGPGEHATIQSTTQTSRRSRLCTYTHRGQAAGHERLKFISGCIHYTVKGLQLGLGNCGASVWLWQDSLTAQKWLS